MVGRLVRNLRILSVWKEAEIWDDVGTSMLCLFSSLSLSVDIACDGVLNILHHAFELRKALNI